MVMQRTFDPCTIHSVCRLIGWDVDLSPFIEDQSNWFFVNDAGIFAAVWRAGALFDVHTAFLPGARGVYALRALEQAIGQLFAYAAEALVATIPLTNRACRHLAVALGFVPAPGHAGSWEGCALRYYAMSRTMWLRRMSCQFL